MAIKQCQIPTSAEEVEHENELTISPFDLYVHHFQRFFAAAIPVL